jgi:hypothetical protein
MAALWMFLFGSLLATAGVFAFYPAPSAETLSTKKSILMMAPAIILMLGAIWYFLSSLRTFKPGLRSAYILLSVGILLLPLPTVLLVLALSFPDVFLPQIEAIRHIIIISFIAAAIMMYLGIALFARLLSVKHLLVKSIFVMAVAAASALIAVKFLDEATTAPAKYGLQSLAASTVITFGACLFAVRIKKTLGAIYTPAINWLIAAFVVVAFDYAANVALSLWPEKFLNYLDYSDWPLILSGITFLMAGYFFWRSGHIARPSDTATYLDSVNYAAQMVSDPEAIDPILDRVRVITARQRNNKDLKPTEKNELVEVYLKVEDYLINDDPLRNVSKDNLRSALSYDFQEVLRAYKPAAKKATH